MGKKTDMMLCDNIMSVLPMVTQIDKPKVEPGRNVPDSMILDIEDSGIYFGLETTMGKGYYVGKPAECDGNILALGVNGSGKSSILVKSTLETCRDVIVAIDIKGELSRHYQWLLQNCLVQRPYIVFNPSNVGSHYDVYALLKKGGPNFVQYVREIACAIIPKPSDVREPYWIDMARDLLSGAIVYYYELGLDFIGTILMVQDTPIAELCKEIVQEGSDLARMFVSEIAGLKQQQQSAIGTEVKRHTMVFATDPDIQSALSFNKSDEDGFGAFSWEGIVSDADAPNVFLCISQDRLEQWGGVLRLMITQLIRQLERRPEKYSPQGRDMKPFLLLLDEFPLLGKMDVIQNAMTTLRSKNVTLYIVVQSIAQLDEAYGANIRKILVDNCQYKAILQVTEPETQEYLSKMIGTVPTAKVGASQSYSPYADYPTWGTQIQEIREPLILPHEFNMNEDIWLHSSHGFLSTIKLPVFISDLSAYKFDNAISEYFKRRHST